MQQCIACRHLALLATDLCGTASTSTAHSLGPVVFIAFLLVLSCSQLLTFAHTLRAVIGASLALSHACLLPPLYVRPGMDGRLLDEAMEVLQKHNRIHDPALLKFVSKKDLVFPEKADAALRGFVKKAVSVSSLPHCALAPMPALLLGCRRRGWQQQGPKGCSQ